MATSPSFNVDFAPIPGVATPLNQDPLVRRITANNPSAYTFKGTNSYLIGSGSVAVLDPGPDDTQHLSAIDQAISASGGVPSHIVLTHHHPDHIAGVASLKSRLGVPVFGTAQCQAAGAPVDVILVDGDEISGDGWALEALATPGHTADHLCFGLLGTDKLFSGDHVMGWSSSVIIPPDGNLSSYLASLTALEQNSAYRTYWPGHGDVIDEGPGMARALREHRLLRSRQIVDVLGLGPTDREDLLDEIYPHIGADLRGAAAQSLESHIIDLIEKGEIFELYGDLNLS